MAKTTNPWNGLRVSFESMADFLEFAENDQPGMVQKNQQASRRGDNYNGPGWAGSESIEQALDFARRGWPEGTEKLEKLRAPIVDKLMPVILRPEIQYELVGTGGLDMGRVMAGMPDPFMEWQDSETPVFGSGRQLVRVVMNIAASAGIKPDAIIARGAGVAALVDALEAAGRRVSVVVVEAVTGLGGSSDKLVAMVLVKRPDSPLNIDTLTFAVAHPSMLRRLFFSVQERHPDAEVRRRFSIPGAYGMPADVDGDERGDIYMGSMTYGDANFVTPETTRRWVLEKLVEQGVQLDDELLQKAGLK